MAGDDDPKEFPDVSHKLSAPKKLSAFERERQAAERKRRRAEAEDQAELKRFEEEFGNDGGNSNNDDYDGFPRFPNAPSGPRNSGMGFGGPPSRYGGPPGRFGGPSRGGPGSLGPVAGPPPSLKKKRALEERREEQEARREHEDFTAQYLGRNKGHGQYASTRDDEMQDELFSRPTVQMSNLPPSSNEHTIRSLLRGHLQVHSVQLQPPSGPLSKGRRSVAASAQLAADTSTAKIESAVSALRRKYLGCGYSLEISRHLSSTSLNVPSAMAVSSAEPFGAQKIDREQTGISNRNAPPPHQFAPPEYYEPHAQHTIPANAYVAVEPPADLKITRAIHTLADRLLSEPDSGHALQLEAMLMALPEIQKDERFAFLYDSRSPAGVYYRFLLWSNNALQMIQARNDSAEGPERVLDDVVLDWVPPAGKVPFADLTSLGEVLDHENYPSDDESDLDDPGDGGERGGEKRSESNDSTCLTPLQVAKLSWLLARMPTETKDLQKWQVAGITSFAVRHARVGAEQIVDMLVLNIEKPYARSSCARFGKEGDMQNDDDDYEPGQELPNITPPVVEAGVGKPDPEDPSETTFVALYLINDILQSCATAKNAWRYRTLFENVFKQRKIFERLGQVPKDAGWGRMKDERWRRRIQALIDIWKLKNIFADDSFKTFEDAVKDSSDGKDASKTTEEPKKKTEEKLLGRFKRIDGVGASSSGSASPAPAAQESNPQDLTAQPSDLDGVPMDDLDGEPMEDLDGEPMEDLDGEPMDDLDGVPTDDVDEGHPNDQPMEDAPAPTDPPKSEASTTASKSGFSIKGSKNSQPAAVEPPKRRKLAEDMFADSDEE
ncbi:hypothetical protein M409DRAFT_65876 [Zasmidium cellare ATCC 36951]|uniref:CID domain-containing protein n=1 Tax=Zasmidium cellare ATCC 36951 TaxID=1080233 RepID=A0A6A6CKU9_ZASCE|nr:uncharacterized protein M409DRAFT_65876 [Zasmidium cellare ATCC 36951]KAF2167775.1 hypothetical protein M409DRAFT_65876 [Zasmidium cellare ATCC 36951]